jgi:hypothetical protein
MGRWQVVCVCVCVWWRVGGEGGGFHALYGENVFCCIHKCTVPVWPVAAHPYPLVASKACDQQDLTWVPGVRLARRSRQVILWLHIWQRQG